MTDPVAIAASLTKAQRDVVIGFGDEARDYSSIQARVRINLFQKGILRLSAWSGSPQEPLAELTPLGLTVRQHLHDAAHLQQNGEGVGNG